MYRKTSLKIYVLSGLLLGLACFGLPQRAQAVSPPPDGGYFGGNTAEGQNALLNLTTGRFNTAVGWFSLRAITTGHFNTAIGARTLLANTADRNTAIGVGALSGNTTGVDNAATGALSLFFNTTGIQNTAAGAQALFSNTEGICNSAFGWGALTSNTGDNNTAAGAEALFSNTTGTGNVAIGYTALLNNTTGTLNTALGYGAGSNVTMANNVIAIGSAGANVSNSCFIGNIRDVTTVNGDAIPVLIDSAGQLGTASSSVRFKKDIKPMSKASESILALKPVTFHYNGDKTGTPQFGLIAEEVAEVNPDLVLRDENGEIYTVRYDAVNAMLLNEFLKEHRKVEQQNRRIQHQEASIAQLKSIVVQQERGMETLSARLEEQDSRIQKVSAQVEVSRLAPQMAENNR